MTWPVGAARRAARPDRRYRRPGPSASGAPTGTYAGSGRGPGPDGRAPSGCRLPAPSGSRRARSVGGHGVVELESRLWVRQRATHVEAEARREHRFCVDVAGELTGQGSDVLLASVLWPRGLLIGLAAAVKLTPLIGLLFFVLCGNRRAVVVGLLSFFGATGLGALLAPRDSLRYWTWAVFAVDRIGKATIAGNQNLRAVVARLELTGPVGVAVWAVAAVVVVGLATVAARRALRASQPALALVVVAIAGLLVSPMSWSHHWVWCVPALLVLADLGRIHRIPRWLATTGLVLFLISPHAVLPHRPPAAHWPLWQQVAGAGYVLWALLLLAAAAAAGHRWVGARPAPGQIPTTLAGPIPCSQSQGRTCAVVCAREAACVDTVAKRADDG